MTTQQLPAAEEKRRAGERLYSPVLLRTAFQHMGERPYAVLFAVWGGALILSILLSLAAVAFEWSGIAVPMGGVAVHVTFYPPLIICTLLSLWLGFWWGAVPAYVATLVLALYAGMPAGWAVLFAFADPLALLVLILAYRDVPIPVDLRTGNAVIFYLFTTIIAAFVGALGAIVWTHTNGLGMGEAFSVWQGWWFGMMLQGIVVTAPLLWLSSPAVLRWKNRLDLGRPWQMITMRRMAVTSATLLILFVVLILSSEFFGDRQLEIVLGSLEDPGLRRRLLHADRLMTSAAWISLGGIAFSIFFGYQIAVHWAETFRRVVDVQTKRLRAAHDRLEARVNLRTRAFRKANRRLKREVAERRRIEEALRESEEHLQDFLENANDLIQSVAPDGRFTYVNRAWRRTMGYDEEDLKSLTLPDVIHPDSRAACMEKFKAVMKGESVEDVEAVFVTRTGRQVVVSGSVNCRFEDGRPVATRSIFRDITERKRAEETLREREQQLAHAQAIAHLGSWEWDVAANQLTWSDEMRRIYGVGPDEPLDYERFVEMLHPDDRERVQQIVQRSFENHEPFRYFHRIIRADDGRVRILRGEGEVVLGPDGQVARMVGTGLDVTEMKQAEEALRESEDRFRVLSESTFEGIFISRGGSILDANDQGLALLGYDRSDEVIGRSPLLFTEPESRDQVARMNLENRSETYEATMRRRDGTTFIAEVRGRAMPYAGGTVRVTAIRDVTERKRVEQALRKSEQRLRLLYEVTSQAADQFEVQLGEVLRLTTELLGLDVGILSRIEGDVYTVVGCCSPDGSLAPGQTFPFGDTYCSITIAAEDVVAIDHMVTSDHVSHPCYEKFGLESYIGIPIRVGGEPYGTLNFSSARPKRPAFDELDRDFMRLLALWVAAAIERDRAQQAVHESEERLELALRGADLGLWDWNLQTGEVLFSRRWAEMIEYEPDEIATSLEAWADLVHPDDLPRVMKALNDHLDGHTAFYEAEHRMQTKSGEWKWILDRGKVFERAADGTPLRAVGTHLDITERKRAGEALQESQDRYRQLVESANDLIYRTDDRGLFIYANPVAVRVTGYTEAEIIGRSYSELVRPDYQQRAIDFYRKQFMERIQNTYFEFPMTARDGREVWIGQNVQLVIEDGRIVGTQAVARDITARKQAEQALRQAKEAAEAASRAKSSFLATMSHELRTPLNSIIGFSNVLLKNRHGRLDEKELDYLARVRENGKHLLGLINEILDLSKIEAGRAELMLAPLQVEALIHDVVHHLEGRIEGKNVEMRVTLPDEVTPIEADREKLKQVLINLVGNAVKFTEEGTVEVRLETHDGRPVRIDVVDTGIGIHEDQQGEIFEAFRQVDESTTRRYEGTGLGLTICRSLCDLMGYGLTLQSRPGEGSTFSIILEGAEAAAVQQAPIWAASGRAAEEGRLVLVIDHDMESRLLMAHYLEDMGYQIITARSGKQGIEMARTYQPDLITLDLLMPSMTGWEVLHGLKEDEMLRDIPVVVVSVVAGENRGTLMGAVDVIEKPIRKERLQEVLQRNMPEGARSHVLVIDDELDARKLIEVLLEEEGCRVSQAASGQEGIEALERFVPDLVLLDLMMPEMDGLQFLEAVRKEQRFVSLPVVVVTAKDLDAAEKQALSAAAVAVVQKSETLEGDLKRQIRTLMQSR